MVIKFEKSPQDRYKTLLEDLFKLDRAHRADVNLLEVVPHFFQIQSLIRSSIEYSEVAFRETNLGHVFPARALLRSAFDHIILASYLYKHPDGAEITQLILDKNKRELADHAISAGAVDSGEKLLEIIETSICENGEISTRTGKLIDFFSEKKILHDFHFLLGQAVHPKAVFFQYLEIDEKTGMRQIRRTTLDNDTASVHPFTFQILSIAMLLDADSRNEKKLRLEVLKRSKELVFGPELTF